MEVRAIGIVDCEEDSIPLDALGLSDSPAGEPASEGVGPRVRIRLAPATDNSDPPHLPTQQIYRSR